MRMISERQLLDKIEQTAEPIGCLQSGTHISGMSLNDLHRIISECTVYDVPMRVDVIQGGRK